MIVVFGRQNLAIPTFKVAARLIRDRAACLLYPQKRTLIGRVAMSALCQ